MPRLPILDHPPSWDRTINLRDWIGIDGSAYSPQPVGHLINEAIQQGINLWGDGLSQSGGMRLLLPPSPGPYFTGVPIVLADFVELHIAAGAILQSYTGAVGGLSAMISIPAGVEGARVTGGGLLLGTYDFTSTGDTLSGIVLNGAYACTIEDIRIAGFPDNGIYILGSAQPDVHKIRGVMIQECGYYGMHLSAVTDCIVSDSHIFSNGQSPNVAGAGAGVSLKAASLRNSFVNCNMSDFAASFPAIQKYPLQEEAASGCDYTKVYCLQASGNVTSNAPQFVGAHSGSV